MGHIHEDHGCIAIETNGSESFTIHASYGYRAARVAVDKLMPGEYFFLMEGEEKRIGDRDIYKVESINETDMSIIPVVNHALDKDHRSKMSRSDLMVIPCSPTGIPSAIEEDPLSGSWRRMWREMPHPEFMMRDLNDLIEALIEIRDKE